MQDSIAVSVIVPIFNEAPNIEELCTRLFSTLDGMAGGWEVLAVDDGSSDASVECLRKMQAKEGRLCIVRLIRNFGQTPALYAGFSQARGQVVVSIDADLQNPPEEIPKVVEELGKGYDVVQGWRQSRQDTAFRRFASRGLNKLVSRVARVEIRDLGCGLKAFSRETVDRLCMFKHHARYLPAEIIWMGARIGEVRVEHNERKRGDSKYGIGTLLRLYFDLLVSITDLPLVAVNAAGWCLTILGALLWVWKTWAGRGHGIGMLAGLMLFVGGVQIVALGVLGQYLTRILRDVQQKPYYVIRDVLEQGAIAPNAGDDHGIGAD